MLPPPNAVLDAAATAPKADAPPKAGADPNAGAEPNAGAPPNAGGAPKAPVFDGDVALVELNPWLIILLPVPEKAPEELAAANADGFVVVEAPPNILEVPLPELPPPNRPLDVVDEEVPKLEPPNGF